MESLIAEFVQQWINHGTGATIGETAMIYRVNYGNSQVSNEYNTKKEAMRHRAEMDTYQEYAFIQFRDAESGEWFSCGAPAKEDIANVIK